MRALFLSATVILLLGIAVFGPTSSAQRLPEPLTPHYPQDNFTATQPFDGSRPIHIFCLGCSAGIGRAFTVEACKYPNVQVTACARREEGTGFGEVSFPRIECHATSSIAYFECDVERPKSIAKIPSRIRKLRGNSVKLDHVLLNVGRGNLGLTRSFTMEKVRTIFDVTAFGKQEVYRVLRNSGILYLGAGNGSTYKTRFTNVNTLGSFIPGIDWQGIYAAAKAADLFLTYDNMNEDGNYLEFTIASPTAVCNTEYEEAAEKPDETNCPYAEDIALSSNAIVLSGAANTPQTVAQCYLQTMQTVYADLPNRRFICSSTGNSVGFPVSDRLVATNINMASLDFMNNATAWVEDQLVGRFFGVRPTGVRHAAEWCPGQ